LKENSYLCTHMLPAKLNRLLYNLKDDKTELLGNNFEDTLQRVKNVLHFTLKSGLSI